MATTATYDVFLSHASPDKPAVERLARRLKRNKLKPFLDKWHLVPGEPWQEALEEALDQSQTFAIFLGPGGLGAWHNEEMRAALDTRARDKSRRVIPVLLPGAAMPSEKALPRFLKRLTWVDFRNDLADPDAFHRLVCGIKGIPPGDGQAATAPPALIGIPHRNPSFTGREVLLSQLHQQLQAKGISALAQAAIFGLGGIGKTQTAIEYAYRFGKNYRFILWVVAEEETAIRAAYRSIARELGLVETQADLETAVLAVKTWLSREDDWLLIYDNADDPALVRAYLPVERTGGKVLLTSQAKSFVNIGIKKPIRVDTLEPDDAVKFLVKRMDNADTQAAAALAAELGYLPLALEQAVAYIETVGGGFAEYLARYSRQGVALFAKSAPSTGYSKTVATTWSLSFDALRKASPASTDLLIAASFLVPDYVPIEIFTLGGSEVDGLLAQALKSAGEDPLDFWELLFPLERYSLVERLPDDAFKLHRLTQEVVKNSLREEELCAWAGRVVRALNAAYPSPDFEFGHWNICEKLQPSVGLACELIRLFKIESGEAISLLTKAGSFAWQRGSNADAKTLFENALGIQERVLGCEHRDTLMTRIDLANNLGALGDVASAKRLYEQTLETQQRVLGVEHQEIFMTRNNLGNLFFAVGDFEKAREILEDLLAVEERVLGAEHTLTQLARANLAMAMSALGDLVRSRGLHEKNLEICERTLGRENPRITIFGGYLLGVLLRLEDLDAINNLLEKFRWLLDRDENSIISLSQKMVRRDLLKLLGPS